MDICRAYPKINHRYDISKGRSTMKYFMALIGVVFLGIGSVGAAP